MVDRPRKLDAQSSKILKELKQCVSETGGQDYTPPGFEVHKERLAEEAPEKGFRFAVPPLVGDEEYWRLKGWLTELAEADKPVAFSAVLQVWLDIHGIAWPAGIFKTDTATYGSGIFPSELGREAARLHAQFKNWGEVAKRLIPGECKTPANRRRASDKVRLAGTAFSNGVRREKPLEGSVAALVWKMLGTKPDKVLAQELRDDLADTDEIED